MTIADKLTLLAASKEIVRLKLGIGADVPFSEYGDHIGWDGITSALGQSTTTAASQKLVTDEVDKAKDREALLQTSITTILGINKKLTNRINALEESNISSLFNNEASNGIWLDPSDLSTLFQDAAGTIPVTKDGDPVGLILDKSQGVTGETVLNMTDIDFNDGTWNSSSNATGNRLSNLVQGTAYARYDLRGLVDRSKNYKVVIRLKVNEVGSVNNVIKAVLGELNTSVEYLSTSINKDTTELVANITGGGLEFFNIRVYMLDVDILNIEITELLGKHATQTVSASRPVYKKDADKAWLYNDKIDDKMLVKLPAMTATVIKATDEGVSIDYPVSITAGDTVITSTSVLGRDYGHLIINKELSVSEITQVTNYFNAKRGV